MDQSISEFLLIVVPLSLVLFLAGLIPFRRYTGLGRAKAYIALFASVIVGDIQTYQSAQNLDSFFRSGDRYLASNLAILFHIVAAGFVVPLLTAFVLRLWNRWIGGQTTAEERLPGAAGIQAWFSASNITVGLLIILCAWLGHDVSPLLTGTTVTALLAAQPLFGLDLASPIPASAQGPGLASVPRPPAEDLAVEREKILSMLEAGKLTAEESAELLQALGESSRRTSTTTPVPLTGHQRLMLIGAAIVALGFFLPWFSINPGKEATRAMNQVQSNVQANLGPDAALINALSAGTPHWTTDTMNISGGDIHRGLGWTTLILALAAAMLPYVATHLDSQTTRTIRLLCLGLGTFIILYLLTQNIRFVGLGLIITTAGYALEIAGALRERRAAV